MLPKIQWNRMSNDNTIYYIAQENNRIVKLLQNNVALTWDLFLYFDDVLVNPLLYPGLTKLSFELARIKGEEYLNLK
jgi:hypothetical protein